MKIFQVASNIYEAGKANEAPFSFFEGFIILLFCIFYFLVHSFFIYFIFVLQVLSFFVILYFSLSLSSYYSKSY